MNAICWFSIVFTRAISALRQHVDRNAGRGSAGQPVVGVRSGVDRHARPGAGSTDRTGRAGTPCARDVAGRSAFAGRTPARARRDDRAVDRRAAVARHPLAIDFDELIEIDPPWECRNGRGDRANAFRPVFRADDRLARIGPRAVHVVVPSGRLGHDLGCAVEFRRAYQDEGDPEPPHAPKCPIGCCPKITIPTSCLGIVHSYAGQVSLLDTCLEAFLEFLAESKAAEEPLLAGHVVPRLSAWASIAASGRATMHYTANWCTCR